MVTGCGSTTSEEAPNYYITYGRSNYHIEVDKITCVQYITSNYKMTIRSNQDGTPILDEKCLKEQMEE